MRAGTGILDGACLELADKLPGRGTSVAGSEEAALIRRAQQGDRAAFDTLVRMYDQKVLRLALQIVRAEDLARDLYQEAFLKVYRALPHFKFQSSFSTWLHRVVTNVCLDYLRKQSVREEVPAPEGQDGEPEFFHNVADGNAGNNPEAVLRAKEIEARLRKAMDRLSARERMVFELRHYQGLRLKHIGDMCGTSEETAKNCLFRATQKLRSELQDLV